MLAELIDRRAMKEEARQTLRDAQVPPKAFAVLYFALILALNLVDSFTGAGILAVFVTLLVTLLSIVLEAGFVLYCMAVRRGERAEYLTLFDGFSLAGKIIALSLLEFLFIFLWSMLFTIPGIVAAYRYRFALYNLCEDPEITPLEALNMSKRQTLGYKSQLLGLDLSYLGWLLLAAIPQLVYNFSVFGAALQEYLSLSSAFGEAVIAPLPADYASLLPLWAWVLVIGLWLMAVSPFFRPVYQCAELGYFETAKRTSGVGAGNRPFQTTPTGAGGGPDGLGGI